MRSVRMAWRILGNCASPAAIGSPGAIKRPESSKVSPLKRVQPGDRIVYYSPNQHYSASHAQRGKDRLQTFTAIGTVKEGKPYRADMGGGFQPFRRDVTWHEAEPVSLALLLQKLALTQEKNWGYRLRQGLVEISDADMTTIAEAMFAATAASAEPYRLAA